MSPRNLGVCLLLAACIGCVPVTAPLADPAKAEPDKRLLGQWTRENHVDTVDMPAVEGNPKGLMRAVHDGKLDDLKNVFWFTSTTIGKHHYMTVYLDPAAAGSFADFRQSGAFARYLQGTDQRYFIFRYTLEGDKLVVDGGNRQAFEKAMAAAKIAQDAGGSYPTPPGWLAKYLATNDPTTIYDGTNQQDYRRVVK